MQLLQGNCLDVLKVIPDNSIDSVVTDPPYGLSQQKQEDIVECLKAWIDGKPYHHDKKGFMNKSWDGWVPGPEVWRECYRVLKPGGHMLVFSGTRTQDLMGMAVRLAGFEIREQICWVYGSGFPKSLNLPGGYGTALKPAYEPILMVRKPLSGTVEHNFKTWGTGVLNIDGCRIGTEEEIPINKLESWSGFGQKVQPDYEPEVNTKGRWPANFIHDGSDAVVGLFPITKSGTLSPEHDIKECQSIAMSGKNYYNRVKSVFKGSEGSAARFFYCAKTNKKERDAGMDDCETISAGECTGGRKEGSAGLDNPRAGAGRTSGAKNNHPTVKPIALMRYLCKLITPSNGTILDPFLGSGSTGIGATLEGFDFIGIELSPEYLAIAQKRIDYWKKEEEKKDPQTLMF